MEIQITETMLERLKWKGRVEGQNERGQPIVITVVGDE